MVFPFSRLLVWEVLKLDDIRCAIETRMERAEERKDGTVVYSINIVADYLDEDPGQLMSETHVLQVSPLLLTRTKHDGGADTRT